MAGGAVDDGRVGDVLAVVDHDRPDLDESEERDVGELLQREDEGEEVVGDGLREAVERVEGVRGEGRGHDPFVVRLVQALVQHLAVQGAVDPVDAEVGEAQEDGELQVVPRVAEDAQDGVGEAWVGSAVVDEAEVADFGDEEGHGEDGHYGDRFEGLLDLQAHLVLEVFGVLEGGLVEDEDVAEGCECGVDKGAEEPAVDCQSCCSERISSSTREESQTYHVRIYKLTNCL